MSTKSTVAFGPNFHLYRECLDDASVYLELEGTEFTAERDRVTVAIPVATWEAIRSYQVVDLSLADVTDEELGQRIDTLIAERQALIAAAEVDPVTAAGTHRRNALIGLARLRGADLIGVHDASVEEQRTVGMRELSSRRDEQKKLRAKITALRVYNPGKPVPDGQ